MARQHAYFEHQALVTWMEEKKREEQAERLAAIAEYNALCGYEDEEGMGLEAFFGQDESEKIENNEKNDDSGSSTNGSNQKNNNNDNNDDAMSGLSFNGSDGAGSDNGDNGEIEDENDENEDNAMGGMNVNGSDNGDNGEIEIFYEFQIIHYSYDFHGFYDFLHF